jgi:MFS family permease
MKLEVKARIANSISFLICGSTWAIYAVHIPAIEARIGVTHAILGSLLLLLGGGAFAAMEFAGRIIDRRGSRFVTIWGGVLATLALWGPAFATNAVELGIATFVLGLGIGVLDVGMNAHGLEIERATAKPIYSSFHAFYSLGGVVGAGIGGITLALGMPFQVSMPLLSVVLLAVILLTSKWLLPGVHAEHHETSNKSKSRTRGLMIVLGLGLLSGFSALAEGSAADWSALELTTVLKTTQAEAAAGLASFSIAMFTMRMLVDRIVAKYGRIFVIRWGSLVGALGLTLVVSALSVPAILVGWAILGLGAAGLVPQFFALVDEISEPTVRGRNMGRVLGLTYLGILAGPASIGWLTLFMPLNQALGLCLLLILVVFLASFRLKVSK